MLVGAFFTCVVTLGFAMLAGYRDGTNEVQARQAVALRGTLGAQATLANDDCQNSRFELCELRCAYIATAQPGYAGVSDCLATAQLALSVTPTSSPTISANLSPTAAQVQSTPSATFVTPTSAFSSTNLFIQGQEAFHNADWQNAMTDLEALSEQDPTYQASQVADMLVQTYEALAQQYKNSAELSQMIIVIDKAQNIRSLDGTDWAFTKNVAQLYLDGKGYLATSDYARADTVFNRLMPMAPLFLDTSAQACKAFKGANDSTALQKYKC